MGREDHAVGSSPLCRALSPHFSGRSPEQLAKAECWKWSWGNWVQIPTEANISSGWPLLVLALQRRDGGWQEHSTSEVEAMWSFEMDQEAAAGLVIKGENSGAQ